MNMYDFYKGKTVFITGHTGFKGAWMCSVLNSLGAKVVGYSLAAEEDSLYQLLETNKIVSYEGDVRDLNNLSSALSSSKADIVIHMAAQAIVKESFNNPVFTYDTNVMGTVNILESIRQCPSVKSVVNVTTDKVYQNHEWIYGYREIDVLNGYDPYSNSKSCADIITQCYKKNFLQNRAVSICRAGNVIGGGDFACNRIIPDCYRSAIQGIPVKVRNPKSIRPYQHVLEPVITYLYIAMRQFENIELADEYNIGPDYDDCKLTEEIVAMFCNSWGDLKWINAPENEPIHEATLLKLDCVKLKTNLNWHSCWTCFEAIEKTVEWYAAFHKKEDYLAIMDAQIQSFMTTMGYIL